MHLKSHMKNHLTNPTHAEASTDRLKTRPVRVEIDRHCRWNSEIVISLTAIGVRMLLLLLLFQLALVSLPLLRTRCGLRCGSCPRLCRSGSGSLLVKGGRATHYLPCGLL